MKLLVDTHAILWWLGADDRLSANARQAIARAGDDAVVSAASIWEASIKRAAGKLAGPDLLDAVAAAGLPFLAIDEHHAKLAGELPLLHRDPFDRMIVAQAMIESLVVVTSDAEISRYGVSVVW
ncbi:MAG: type II toxin-antitoxin system VapC family toxin [Myxococcota bacterium]|nr:type II toxin-antitoxin system VapC family toxin [Myxococcota bacterium]